MRPVVTSWVMVVAPELAMAVHSAGHAIARASVYEVASVRMSAMPYSSTGLMKRICTW